MKLRAAGILMHISSLPSAYGIGDLGPGAYRFADFLDASKQSYWQVLPLNPTTSIMGNSPYSSYSSFALNPLYISPELLVSDGYLSDEDMKDYPDSPAERVDYDLVTRAKQQLIDRAFSRFSKYPHTFAFDRFCTEEAHWLDNHALFVAVKSHYDNQIWSSWPEDVKNRVPETLADLAGTLASGIKKEKFIQFLVYDQWKRLKKYCNERGIQLIGDRPIYVTYDSVDVWTHPDIFQLDDNKLPHHVAGVPPDYFSATGQLWGNPLYNWEKLHKQGFRWWIERIQHTTTLVDIIRLDHFRGLVAYWSVPAGESTAVNGSWQQAPVGAFLTALLRFFPALPLIAEDLGYITPDVREAMREFSLPGMKILMFGFGTHEPYDVFMPHNYYHNSVVYTGTHDNNTLKGWFTSETNAESLERLRDYIGYLPHADIVHWSMIRLAMQSIANTVIVPMQDILGLGEEARMNRPSTCQGNWEWRMNPVGVTGEVAATLRNLTELFGRG